MNTTYNGNAMIKRTDLPEHEREKVTDEELRCASHITDEEFRERIWMPELIGQPPRLPRADAGYKMEGVE